jgi:hypothetical protein
MPSSGLIGSAGSIQTIAPSVGGRTVSALAITATSEKTSFIAPTGYRSNAWPRNATVGFAPPILIPGPPASTTPIGWELRKDVGERVTRIGPMEGSTEVRSWLRCYRCWSQNLEVQLHYEGIHRIDPDTGERTDVVDEMQEAVVQCLECMHDQPHLGFHNGRVEPIQDRWERMIAGTPWIASCTVTVDAEDVETCSGPDAGDALSYAAFGDHGTREFFTHVRFHKHDEDRIVVHLLVELYARTPEEATDVLDDAARGTLAITSLAEESRPPASTGRSAH